MKEVGRIATKDVSIIFSLYYYVIPLKPASACVWWRYFRLCAIIFTWHAEWHVRRRRAYSKKLVHRVVSWNTSRWCAGRSELHTTEVIHNGAFSWLRVKHSHQSIKQNNILSRQKGADGTSNVIANEFSYRRFFVLILIPKCVRIECWRKVIPVGENVKWTSEIRMDCMCVLDGVCYLRAMSFLSFNTQNSPKPCVHLLSIWDLFWLHAAG